MPQAFSKDLNLKDNLFHEIEPLRKFIEEKCKNVALFERVLKILLKLIENHPEEILNNEEQIWLIIVTMMFRFY